MTLHILEPALPRQVISPFADVALPFAGNSDTLHAEGGKISFFKLLCLVLNGFLIGAS